MTLTSFGTFFLQGELQERAYRESLSEACGGLDALVSKVWVLFFTGRATGERLQRELGRGVWVAGCVGK